MFQFAGFAPLAGCHAFSMAGCPIRIPADRIVRADPRGFSQLIASFIASGSLGIPHAPFAGLSPCLLYCSFPRARSPVRTYSFLFLRVFSQGTFQKRALSQYVNDLFSRRETLDLRF